jgi:hypothetical protein
VRCGRPVDGTISMLMGFAPTRRPFHITVGDGIV